MRRRRAEAAEEERTHLLRRTSAGLRSLKNRNMFSINNSTLSSAFFLRRRRLTVRGVGRQQGVLPVGQDEGQRGQDGVVQDAQQRQDVGPVDGAVTWREAAYLGKGAELKLGA